MAVNWPDSIMVNPLEAKKESKPVIMNPHGNPWAKYSTHSVVIRSHLFVVNVMGINNV
ncbi:MAG: hypothetical protein QF622_08195 [Candidatus Marinimicrobia bacterium]|jgi:hypothetical protein|nr:hypothetical protein [Candidatus Neomarinimicrobiota bacterium]MDP6089796.1 hypothetical protein [Candidatus Neomarinimicrobiota bacterium]MDP6401335.1 hypothetical protein [Candidatus Neomarinimicrobiota bacterium]MEE3204855.1 hypothetical protein [Candidatus Neomarinimicrobiota bacterium]